MSNYLKLHEWFELFADAYGIDRTEDFERGEGAFLLNSQIESEISGVYKNVYHKIHCMTLIEFHEYFKNINRANPLTDFVYDFKTGYVLINFRMNSSICHEIFVGCMYKAITNAGDAINYERASELYCDKYGFFKSSVTGYGKWTWTTIGNNLKLPSDAKIVFKDWELRREDFATE